MKIAQLFEELENRLEQVGEEPEALAFTYRQIKGLDFTAFVFKMQEEASEQDQQEITQIFDRLAKHEPSQYISGSSHFHGLELKTDQRALIPRPETEELVDLILKSQTEAGLRVLDVGTGTGAIALSLKAAQASWQVTASDLSEEALSLAAENADRLGLDLELIRSDVLDRVEGRFDILVSNPPYIDWEDRHEVGVNVLTSEPHSALFADNAGYAIYERLAQQAPDHLTEAGQIYLEIGYKQGPRVKAIFQAAFPHAQVEVLKDQFGQDRMVHVHG